MFWFFPLLMMNAADREPPPPPPIVQDEEESVHRLNETERKFHSHLRDAEKELLEANAPSSDSFEEK